MGIWYSVDGEVTVPNTKETVEIANRLGAACLIDMNFGASFEDGMLIVEVRGGAYMSTDRANDIEGILKEFGPFATAAAKFETVVEDERDFFLVGSPESVEAFGASLLLDAARTAVKALSVEQAEALFAEAQDPAFRAKES